MKIVDKICTEDNVLIVTIDKLPNEASVFSDVLTVITKQKLRVDMISYANDCRGGIRLLFTTDKDMMPALMQAIRQIRCVYTGIVLHINGANAKLVLKGCIKNCTELCSCVVKELYNHGIDTKFILAGENEISVVVGEENADLACEIIALEFGFKRI